MDQHKNVIIVEDELDFAKMVKIRLEYEGYAVLVAGDAYFGTQEIIKRRPDLVILDLMMPAGGGFALLERIRNIPSTASIPVVILTGKVIDDAVRDKAKKLGVSAIFIKPYENVEFLEAIRNLVS
jgi:DNA-binding response OmpR family regulator